MGLLLTGQGGALDAEDAGVWSRFLWTMPVPPVSATLRMAYPGHWSLLDPWVPKALDVQSRHSESWGVQGPVEEDGSTTTV